MGRYSIHLNSVIIVFLLCIGRHAIKSAEERNVNSENGNAVLQDDAAPEGALKIFGPMSTNMSPLTGLNSRR